MTVLTRVSPPRRQTRLWDCGGVSAWGTRCKVAVSPDFATDRMLVANVRTNEDMGALPSTAMQEYGNAAVASSLVTFNASGVVVTSTDAGKTWGAPTLHRGWRDVMLVRGVGGVLGAAVDSTDGSLMLRPAGGHFTFAAGANVEGELPDGTRGPLPFGANGLSVTPDGSHLVASWLQGGGVACSLNGAGTAWTCDRFGSEEQLVERARLV